MFLFTSAVRDATKFYSSVSLPQKFSGFQAFVRTCNILMVDVSDCSLHLQNIDI